MTKVTVWFNNNHTNSHALVVKWREGNTLKNFTLKKGATETKSFSKDIAKNFVFHRATDDAMAAKWLSLSDDTIINVKDLKFGE